MHPYDPYAQYGQPYGFAPMPPQPPNHTKVWGGLALGLNIAGLVMSLCCWPFGLVLSFVGIPFAFASLHQASKAPGTKRTMGVCALVLGFLVWPLAVVMCVLNVYVAHTGYLQH